MPLVTARDRRGQNARNKPMGCLHYLNPRRHLAAAIGWAVFAVILMAALVGAHLAAREAEQRARADTERLLAQFATQVRHAIDTNIETRQSILQAAAAQIVADGRQQADALARHLDAVRGQFPEFVWLGVADQEGRLMAATASAAPEENVAALSWFQRGRQGAFLGDARYVPLFDTRSPSSGLIAGSPGFVVAVPLKRPSGELIGVLGARLSWEWIEGQENELLSRLETRRSLDLVVAAADNVVLLGPPAWLGRALTTDSDLSEDGDYVIARSLVPPRLQKGLGWIVVLRQDTETALARARLAHRTVFRVVFLAGLFVAIIAVVVARSRCAWGRWPPKPRPFGWVCGKRSRPPLEPTKSAGLARRSPIW